MAYFVHRVRNNERTRGADVLETHGISESDIASPPGGGARPTFRRRSLSSVRVSSYTLTRTKRSCI